MLLSSLLDGLLRNYVACAEKDSSGGTGSEIWATEENGTVKIGFSCSDQRNIGVLVCS